MRFLDCIPERHQKTLRQFIKFGMVGGAGFFVDAGLIFIGIHLLELSEIGAAFFSFPFAVSFTWIGNRLFTFREANHAPAMQQLSKFAAICAVGIVFNRGTYSLLVSTVPFIHHYWMLGLVAGTAAGMFFNFFATRKHVFGM